MPKIDFIGDLADAEASDGITTDNSQVPQTIDDILANLSQNLEDGLREAIGRGENTGYHTFDAVVEANEALTALVEREKKVSHNEGMQFALACTDPWAHVEYPTAHTPIESTADQWLKNLEAADKRNKLKETL